MDIKEKINKAFKSLISQNIRNTAELSSRLEKYCYNFLGVSNNDLWTYIDTLTLFNSGVDELTDQQIIDILCKI